MIDSSRVAAFLLALSFAAPLAAQPVRLAAPFGDDQAEIEVRDLRTDKAENAIRAAFAEISAVLDLATAYGTGPAAANGADRERVAQVDPRFGALVLRAQHFCLWSNGAFGPLAGSLVAQRRQTELTGKGADAESFRRAVASAGCQNLRVVLPGEATPEDALADGATPDPATLDDPMPEADADVVDQPPFATVTLAADSRLDVRGWLRGFAIDRGFETLREHGAGNAWIELGPVRRAIGDGPRGDGWPTILSFPGVETPVTSILLRDQALAVTLPLMASSGRDPVLIDQRNGAEPRTKMVAAIAVTELGIDAEALATSLAIIGLGEGKMRLASLKPLPSALFLLGDGTGQPVRSDYRWLELPQARMASRYD